MTVINRTAKEKFAMLRKTSVNLVREAPAVLGSFAIDVGIRMGGARKNQFIRDVTDAMLAREAIDRFSNSGSPTIGPSC